MLMGLVVLIIWLRSFTAHHGAKTPNSNSMFAQNLGSEQNF